MDDRAMELSKRLNAVASMVTSGHVVCDVGCDHGYVSIFLVKTKKCPKVYALDVREGPLERARQHVEAYACTDYIELMLSDGMKEMPAGIADTLVCAGMGGRLVIKILTESMEKVRGMKELVLQPQSEIGLVREFVRREGFVLADEDMVVEDGKYYPVMRVTIPYVTGQCSKIPSISKKTGLYETSSRKSAKRQAVLDKYGPILLAKRHPVLKEYLLREEVLLGEIRRKLEEAGGSSGQTAKRRLELEEEKEQLEIALAYYKGEGNDAM